MALPAVIAHSQPHLTPAALLPTGEVCLGQVHAIPVGEGRVYRVGSHAIAVFRLRSGAIRALQNRCPHRGGPLSEGLVGADTVLCPFHAWKFHLDSGECVTEPCVLETYAVREEGGSLYLRLPAPVEAHV